jgi:5-hydroxyisourate hydrolase
MSGITTHVLDTSRGRPAQGVPILLEFRAEEGWREMGRGETDADGRARNLLPPDASPAAGAWRLTFDIGTYFMAAGVESFYPEASIVFLIRDTGQHHHVPLLLSPYGYSTYRGS